MEFLLAGPILRRVEPKSVSVWVACSQAFSAKLSIYEGNFPVTATPPLPAATFESPNAQSIRIGEKLFINLITLTVPDPSALNPVSLYSYNITFTKNAGGTETLQSLNLLDDSAEGVKRKKLALGYTKDKLPTFVLPAPSIENIQVVHGSCRKSNGLGKDTLSALDDILKKAVTGVDPMKRPQQLFLTGDQIYADEVGTPLMRYLMPVAQELIGKAEHLPLQTGGGVDVTSDNFPIYTRQHFINDNAKFTSVAAQNHLISFGEYCAMYLMAWNNSVWPDEALSMTETIADANLGFVNNLTAALALNHLPDSFKNSLNDTNPQKQEQKRTKEINRRKKEYREELTAVINFRNSLPKVARAMANIPTYMMMDDHEITDDWYLTKSWRQQTLASVTGRSIIRNGLIAYALFQDWGNDPITYNSGGKQTLLTNAQQLFNNSNVVIPKSDLVAPTENIIGLSGGEGTIKWHFRIATGPTHSLFLDTRTRRHYDRMLSAPGLLKDEALTDQIPEPSSLGNPPVILIVSPAPVLGMALFEEVIQGLVGGVSPDYADYEAWSFNAPFFEKFLNRIQAFQKVILLSGDVHYGFTMVMDYYKKKTLPPPTIEYSTSKIVQLVSSALKNQFDKVSPPVFINARINQLQAAGLMPAERLAWKDKTTLIITGDKTFGINMQLKKEPVLLSPGPAWTSGNTVTPAPDWAWKFENIMDERAEDKRPEKIRMKIIDDDTELTTNPKAFYEKIMDRHIDNSKKHVSRRFVWVNNIGVVSLKKEGDDLFVEHQLWHFLADDDDNAKADAYTLFKTKLDLADPSTIPTIP